MLKRLLLKDPDNDRWLDFARPRAVLLARRHDEVLPVLRAAERAVENEGLFAAGFVCYEAAPGFDPALGTRSRGPLPLVAFGLFAEAERIDAPPPADDDAGADWRFDTALPDYARQVARIRERIGEGQTYQVNYTIRAQADGVDADALFRRIARDAPYGARVELDGCEIVSGSPELFFRLDGERLLSRPMKGTAARGLTDEDDRARRTALANSAKDRAENVMIADMIRNDMGRVARPGSVRAEALYAIEKYPTVWQATSTISASTAAPVSDIFAAMFPCASITGAPKVASMALIRELERSPRGVYTGAIGFLAPGRQATFSVAIRTALVERGGRATYGVGGGIVWDSGARAEYAECRAKADVLRHAAPAAGFRLLETLRWDREAGFALLERHLARLAASAGYFDFRCDLAAVRRALETAVEALPGPSCRVRLELARDGRAVVTTQALAAAAPAGPLRVRLAREPVAADDLRLFHKTSDRRVYERARAGLPDCDDVLLWNRDGLVTESTIANLLCRFGREWVTPRVSAGLLPGTLRAELIASGEIAERPIRVAELAGADEMQLVNSVRGRRPCELVGENLPRAVGG